ncbi:50S ribosomal protein L30 [Candidatus Pacearchaeota archaeon]|nr:50S ribosomal protein L30 [Candidatus Pacearchaeota archaeon]
MGKIILLRIRGMVDVRREIKKTLDMLKLRKKFVAVIVNDTKEMKGMIDRAKDYLAYQQLDEKTLILLLTKRAKLIGNKDAKIDEKTISEFAKKFLDNKAELEDLKIKTFFSLHPPRGGFKKSIKYAYPKGVLGNNKDLNKLIERML